LQYQIDNYSQAIRIVPDYIFANINRGRIYKELGNYKNAIEEEKSSKVSSRDSIL